MSNEMIIFGEDWPFSKAKTVLLKAAADVMRDAGPRAATLKNIAGKAGVTEPAIFRHFDGVDGMFQSLFSMMELYLSYFMDLHKYDEFMGVDRLESVFTKTLQTIKDDKELSYLLVQPDAIFRQYPKLKTRLKELHQKERSLVLECLKEAKAKGQLLPTTDIESTAYMFIGATLLILQGWIDGDFADPVKEGKKTWTALKAMIAKPGLPPLMRPKSSIEQKKPVNVPVAKVEPKAKPVAKAMIKAKPAAKAESKAKTTVKSAIKTAAKPIVKPAAKPAPKAKPKAVAKAKPAPKKK